MSEDGSVDMRIFLKVLHLILYVSAISVCVAWLPIPKVSLPLLCEIPLDLFAIFVIVVGIYAYFEEAIALSYLKADLAGLWLSTPCLFFIMWNVIRRLQ